LARVGDQPECTAGAQLEVRYLDAPVDAADHQTFFAPVELERLAQCKLQRDEGSRRLAFPTPPVSADRETRSVCTVAHFVGRSEGPSPWDF
jgi:hypothetical protein